MRVLQRFGTFHSIREQCALVVIADEMRLNFRRRMIIYFVSTQGSYSILWSREAQTLNMY